MSPDFANQDERFQRAFAVLRTGIEQKAFPGASVAIAHQGRLVSLKGLGCFTYAATAPMVAPQTVYDLASLTKVLATTTACMILYERGALGLDAKVVETLPEFGGDDQRRSQVTFRMLLAHSSGLPAYVRLFETSKDRTELLGQAARVALVADPGTIAEYSDIGFILLGAALERITGERLNEFCQREIFSRMEISFATYRPPFSWMPLIPPTEDDRTFRHCVVRGQVHDENAWVMGGVAGHAGCFATPYDVAAFAQCMLNGAPLVQAHTVDLFTRREGSPAGTSRALGWDTPSPPSQSGKCFSTHSYGHLGYTGTSLWNDPERQLSVTLLTNRTWPDRSSQAIKQIRPAFHDAVIEAIDLASRSRAFRMGTPELETERQNLATIDLDTMSALEIARRINDEDKKVAGAVEKALPQIAQAIDAIAAAILGGGRLIYVGAGTSGRIAALDAAECAPTFGTDPKCIRYVIAGGEKALGRATEASEDSRALGRRDVARLRPGKHDVVVGVAASGRTPYTIAAVEYARKKGASTVAVVANPGSELGRVAHIEIVAGVGPEVLTGSTRLKAGTAQKMVLNMLTTGAMARLGYIYGNLMVNVHTRNEKLVERGLGILEWAAGVDRTTAVRALKAGGNQVAVALVMLKTGLRKSEAERKLRSAKGNVRKAIEST